MAVTLSNGDPLVASLVYMIFEGIINNVAGLFNSETDISTPNF